MCRARTRLTTHPAAASNIRKLGPTVNTNNQQQQQQQEQDLIVVCWGQNQSSPNQQCHQTYAGWGPQPEVSRSKQQHEHQRPTADTMLLKQTAAAGRTDISDNQGLSGRQCLASLAA
jgi:hypothetical protein